MELKIQEISPKSANERSATIAVGGRLDTATHKQLEDVLAPRIASGLQTLILDFKDLTFISSAGIRVLMTASTELAKRNGSLLITNLQPQIAKVLEIIQALPGLAVFSSVQEMDEYLAAMQRKVIEEKGGN
jgi:anti-anti-sigma factor